MTTVMVADFSGMVPIRDPLLLPDNNAQFSENAWLYLGRVRGFRHANQVYTTKYADTKSVYRIPSSDQAIEDFVNSTWLEFPDPYMSVVRNPTVGDQYNRYYFFPSDQYASTGANPLWPTTNPGPVYGALADIKNGLPFHKLGIPQPTVAPGVTPNPIPADQTRHYLYAWADSGGVDGPPSPDESADGLVTGTWVITIPPPLSTADVSNQPTLNVYRSVSVSGALQYHVISSQALVKVGYVTVNDNYSDAQVSSFPQLVNYDATMAAPAIGASIVAATIPAQETRAYIYTYVSAYSEEGAPSPATVADGQTTGTWVITMTCPTAAQMQGRNLTHMRLYRTVTDASGNTSYFQVIEVAITTAGAVVTYNDSFEDSDITANKPLDTVDYTAPPADLQGVVMMANGIAAGWSNEREIWFSAAYLLHAFPGVYALSVDYPVVGLTPNGSSLNIVTAGSPSIATGVTPDTMTIGKVVANEPCISRGSVVGSGEGAYYASPNGYILLTSGGTLNVTGALMDKEFWNALQPQNFATGIYGKTLVGFIKGSGDGEENGVVIDYGAGTDSSKNVPFTYINTMFPLVNVYNDELSGQVFYITDNQVMQWNPPNGGTLWPYVWRSKIFRFTAPQQFKAFEVYYDIPPEVTVTPGVRNTDQAQVYDQATQLLIVRIFGDGDLLVVREIQRSGETLLIPGGSKWTMIEFQLEGQVNVGLFKMASSVKELKAA
jgi:hypothetical protein